MNKEIRKKNHTTEIYIFSAQKYGENKALLFQKIKFEGTLHRACVRKTFRMSSQNHTKKIT